MISVTTTGKTEVTNITPQVAKSVRGVADGVALVLLLHTTAALLMCEGDDPDLFDDLVRVAERWLADARPFTHARHGNPNAEAHILSAFGGTQLAVPVRDGELSLGTYQHILLLELDGPRQRTVDVVIVPQAAPTPV